MRPAGLREADDVALDDRVGCQLAMKADAARPEDHNDLLVLRDQFGLKTAEEALAIVERYIPANRRTIKTQLTVESLFE